MVAAGSAPQGVGAGASPAVPPGPKVGLVLSGGAARGAYEAGVLRYIYCDLPKQLGFAPWPWSVSGTSVGALNGGFVAGRRPEYVRRLSRIWQRMRIQDVYQLPEGGVLHVLRELLWPQRESALLDPTPLVDLITRNLPWDAARSALDSGQMGAFVVAATDLADGFNTLFVHTAYPNLRWDVLPGTRLKYTPLSREHLLASAALPLLFPPVRVGERWFVDGALRQNTPLRPALMSGANRVLVVGLQAASAQIEAKPLVDAVPSLPFLLGKSLNALLLDPVARDFHRAELINRIVDWGEATYGAGFADKLEAGTNLRRVRLLHLRPREDIGRLASQVFRSAPPEVDTRLRWLLSQVADRANETGGESDLLSYVLFDREYTALIERLGWEDARDQEAELLAFFAPDET